jgi:hypothetical protein
LVRALHLFEDHQRTWIVSSVADASQLLSTKHSEDATKFGWTLRLALDETGIGPFFKYLGRDCPRNTAQGATICLYIYAGSVA